jgi:hypothetical protein
LVRKDLEEPLVLRGLGVHLDLKVLKVHRVLKVQLEQVMFKVRQVLQVVEVLKVPKETQDLKEHHICVIK